MLFVGFVQLWKFEGRRKDKFHFSLWFPFGGFLFATSCVCFRRRKQRIRQMTNGPNEPRNKKDSSLFVSLLFIFSSYFFFLFFLFCSTPSLWLLFWLLGNFPYVQKCHLWRWLATKEEELNGKLRNPYSLKHLIFVITEITNKSNLCLKLFVVEHLVL